VKPLKLSTASANWVMGEHNNQWIVTGAEGEVLGKFPKTWKAGDCMIAIRLGRVYELEAFNRGIDFGKSEGNRILSPIIKKLNADVEELTAMNERLSTQLEKFIIGDENGVN